jgi:hypothetical protein
MSALTLSKWMNLASAACGVLDAAVLYYGSYGYESFPGYMPTAQQMEEIMGRNQRRRRWQRFGLGLITISFALQGATKPS